LRGLPLPPLYASASSSMHSLASSLAFSLTQSSAVGLRRKQRRPHVRGPRDEAAPRLSPHGGQDTLEWAPPAGRGGTGSSALGSHDSTCRPERSARGIPTSGAFRPVPPSSRHFPRPRTYPLEDHARHPLAARDDRGERGERGGVRRTGHHAGTCDAPPGVSRAVDRCSRAPSPCSQHGIQIMYSYAMWLPRGPSPRCTHGARAEPCQRRCMQPSPRCRSQ
jgi:hypothetical protein